MSPPETPSDAPAAPAPHTRTRKQVTAAVLAEGIARKARWKTLIADAKAVWPKISTQELATVHGDVHRLAGMVQLRCQLSREESDRQVKAFFDRHAAAV